MGVVPTERLWPVPMIPTQSQGDAAWSSALTPGVQGAATTAAPPGAPAAPAPAVASPASSSGSSAQPPAANQGAASAAAAPRLPGRWGDRLAAAG